MHIYDIYGWVAAQQKLTQCCKALFQQLKYKHFKKNLFSELTRQSFSRRFRQRKKISFFCVKVLSEKFLRTVVFISEATQCCKGCLIWPWLSPTTLGLLGFCSHDTENSLFIKCVQNKIQIAKFDSFKLIAVSLSFYQLFWQPLSKSSAKNWNDEPFGVCFPKSLLCFPSEIQITITTLQIYSAFV